MKRSSLIMIAAAIVVVILALSFFASRNTTNQTTPSPSPSATALTPSPTASPGATASPQSTSSPAASNTAPTAVTMDYTNSGFQPTSITLKSGGTITFKNSSGSTIQVDSNPHPEHTDNPDLNAGLIGPGQSKTLTLTRTGAWRIHDHLNASHQATVTVE